MKYSFDVKISEHIWEDSLGQLICLDAIIAREGYQEYYEDDVLKNGSYKIVKVLRPWDEVKKSAPTFEAKPIIIQHPDKSVDIDLTNMKEYKVGHMQNIKESEYEGIKVLTADLVFDDKEAIKKVKAGTLRELSCGYFYEIDTENMRQYDIKGEHLALVQEGRAGIAKIRDAKQDMFALDKYLKLKDVEAKDLFMGKIPTEDLEGMKKYFNDNVDNEYTDEEIEMTIKIVDREINKRNHYDMGLSEEAIKAKAQDEFLYDEVKMSNVKRGNTVYIKGISERGGVDYTVAKIVRNKDDDEVILKNKEGEDIMIGSWNEPINIMKSKSNDGLSSGKSIASIAEMHGVAPVEIRLQIRKGTKVEMEHTDDRREARTIAMDHLVEEADYYDKLEDTFGKEDNQPSLGEWEGDDLYGQKEFEEEDEYDREANDLYIEDDEENEDMSMEFDEKDLAWIAVPVVEIIKGDIVSENKSTKPYEVNDIERDETKITLFMVPTDDSDQYGKEWTIEIEEYVDLLINSQTGDKVTFRSKSRDDSGKKQMSDIIVGDHIINSKGNVLPVTKVINNQNGTFTIRSNKTDIYIDAEANTMVPIK